jgi:SSS family solute:Na+ symporter
VATPTTAHWAGSVDIEFGHTVYIGLTAIIINIAVSVILTLVFKATRVPEGADETLPHQYTADPAQAPAPAPAAVGIAGAAGDLSGRTDRGAPVPSRGGYWLVTSLAWCGYPVMAACRPSRRPAGTA